MNSLKELVENAVQKRITEGMFFQDSERKTNCNLCNKPIGTKGAICWGSPVQNYFEFNWHNHQINLPISLASQNLGLSTEIRETAKYVVLVYGRPCFLSLIEKERYLDFLMRGNKIIEIRGYVFDRIYPIMPYEEWKDDEERKNRFVESFRVIND